MMTHCDSVSPSYNLSLLSLLSLLLLIIRKWFCCFLLGLCLHSTYTVLLIHVQDQICEEIPQICKIMAQMRGELTFQVTTVATKIRSLLTFFIGGYLERERERERVNPSPYYHIFNRPWQKLKDDYDCVPLLYSKCCCLMKPEERSLFLLSILHHYR